MYSLPIAVDCDGQSIWSERGGRSNDLWERQKGHCAYCKQKMKLSGGGYDRRKVSIDHVTPKSKDGSDGISNIVLCCLSCNLEKSNLSLKEFASEKGLQFEIESLLL